MPFDIKIASTPRFSRLQGAVVARYRNRLFHLSARAVKAAQVISLYGVGNTSHGSQYRSPLPYGSYDLGIKLIREIKSRGRSLKSWICTCIVHHSARYSTSDTARTYA